VTIAHYWADRPYNVYHWIDRGRTVAYYCNVVDSTSIAPDLVSYVDLVVDVLIDPKGNALVLDEDELPTDLAPPLRLTVARALDQLSGQSKRITAEVEHESRRYV
jgi:predicted RNA-binding protein associated with RNAse of E/G family